MAETVDCIVCSKTMNNLDTGIRGPQPLGGLAFLTYGHYGSTYFDPMDGSYIEIVVCDECLSRAPDGVSKFRPLSDPEGKESGK